MNDEQIDGLKGDRHLLGSMFMRIGELSERIGRRLFLVRVWDQATKDMHAREVAEREAILTAAHPAYGDVIKEARTRGLMDPPPQMALDKTGGEIAISCGLRYLGTGSPEVLAELKRLQQENADLRHDIERCIAIAVSELPENRNCDTEPAPGRPVYVTAPHNGHPMRHYDRTCPGCNPKMQEQVGESK